jgi:hypothetical protein
MKFKSFNLVKMCLMMKIKFFAKKYCIKFLFRKHYFSRSTPQEKEGSGSIVPLN